MVILWINTIEQSIAFKAVERLQQNQWQFSCHLIVGLVALNFNSVTGYWSGLDLFDEFQVSQFPSIVMQDSFVIVFCQTTSHCNKPDIPYTSIYMHLFSHILKLSKTIYIYKTLSVTLYKVNVNCSIFPLHHHRYHMSQSLHRRRPDWNKP